MCSRCKEITLFIITGKYTSPFAIKLPNEKNISFVIFLPALLHVSKSFIGIECNEVLVIPLTSDLLPCPCL